MTRLIRWNPMREYRRMHDMLDSFMSEALVDAPFFSQFAEGYIPLDVYQTEDNVVVKATAPGFKPEDIQISVTGDVISIQGEIEEESKEEGTQYHVRERRFGSFSRSVRLPTLVNADKAQAEFEDGVLTLTLPKVEEVKPKTITVKAK